MNELEELLIQAAAEGLYDGHLDWPALLSEEEADKRGWSYVAERNLEQEQAVLFASGYLGGYLTVENIGKDEPETIEDRAALLISCTRKNGLQMLRQAAYRTFSRAAVHIVVQR